MRGWIEPHISTEHRPGRPVSFFQRVLKKSVDAMPIDLPEDPPIQPGQPAEPPQESPPGNPQPEIPPPMREPGEPQRPDELPGHMPDELPVRGPQTPTSPPPPTDM
jgi:hypothetical protein